MSPSARRSAPAQATIAPLSVQSAGGGIDEVRAGVGRGLAERGADLLVGGDAAGDDEGRRAGDGRLEAREGGGRAGGDDVGDGGLEARGDVGDVLVGERRDLLGGEADGGLEAGEREVEAVLGEQRAREAEALGVAA